MMGHPALDSASRDHRTRHRSENRPKEPNMNFNLAQKIIVVIGCILTILAILFPPFVVDLKAQPGKHYIEFIGFHWIYGETPEGQFADIPGRIYWEVLAIQLVGLMIVTFAGLLISRKRS